MSLAALIAGIVVVQRTQREIEADLPSLPKLDGIALLALTSWPVSYDLFFGQFGCLLFLLLALALRFERRSRMFASGTAIGAAIALKLYGWPLLIRAALMRRYSVIAGAGAVLVVADLGAALLAGMNEVMRYYTDVAPHAAGYYAGSERNISLSTIGTRLFAGLDPGITRNVVEAPPLFHSPALAQVSVFLVPIGSLIGLCYLLRRNLNHPFAFAGFVTLSAIINPVAWETYLVPLILTLVLLAPRLASPHQELSKPMIARALFCISCFVILFAPSLRAWLIGSESEVGTFVGLLTAVPILAVLVLGTQAVIIARTEVPFASPPGASGAEPR